MLIGRVVATLAAVSLVTAGVVAAGDRLPTVLPAHGFEARERDDTLKLPRDTAEQLRQDALARALVWLEPEEPLEAVDLRHNPRDFFADAEEVACKFHPQKTSGSTPKFECVFAGGEVLKVKYGATPRSTPRSQPPGCSAPWAPARTPCTSWSGSVASAAPRTPRRCSAASRARSRSCGGSAPRISARRPLTGEVQIKVDYCRFVDFAPVTIERRWAARRSRTRVRRLGLERARRIRPAGRRGRPAPNGTPCAFSPSS